MSASPQPGADSTLKRRIQPMRVLLVEDDRIDRMAIERHILRQSLPFEIESAQSGAEAVQRLRDRPFDLVLLDYMLGDMTGLELLPELRGVPAIFISGMGNEEIAVRALHQGAYDYVVKDPDRAYLHVLPAIMRNVLERRHAEESLRESQRKLDTLMRNLPGMAYRARGDAGMQLEFVSAGCHDLTGYAEDELTAPGFSLRNLVAAEDEPAYRRVLSQALEKPGAYEATYRIQSRAGGVKWVWERGLVIDDSTSTTLSVEGFLSDITERVRTEGLLREAKDVAEKATEFKDRFVSLVAHDLRVPLTTCSLTFQMLWDELRAALQPRHEELFTSLSNSTKSMLRLIDNLLMVSRLQSGALQPKPRFFGAATIRSTVISLQPLASQKHIGVQMDLPDGIRIYADPDLLGEVIQNLVTNAIKFTPNGGKITVSLSKTDGSMVVRDTGTGIDAGRLKTLLTREAYSSTPGTAGEKGTGLGLRICRDIVAAHNGHLTIESALGSGTVARVQLPMVRPEVLAFDIGSEEREAIAQLLEQSGANLRIVKDGNALDSVRRLRPHLIIMASGRGGERLAEVAQVKSDPEVSAIPVLVLASVPVKQTGPHAPDDVLPLPLDGVALRQHLRRFLG